MIVFIRTLFCIYMIISFTSCSIYSTLPSQVINSRTEIIRETRSERQVIVDQNPGVHTSGKSAIMIRVDAEKSCKEYVKHSQIRERASFNSKAFFGEVFLLGLFNALMIGLCTGEDNPQGSGLSKGECDTYNTILLGSLDVGFLYSSLQAAYKYVKVNTSEDTSATGSPWVECTPVCDTSNKMAYIKLDTPNELYCLELGMLSNNGVLYVDTDKFRSEELPKLPSHVNRYYKGISTHSIFAHSDIVVPQCGDDVEQCMFWKSKKGGSQ